MTESPEQWTSLAEIAAYFGKSDAEIYALARAERWARVETDSGPSFAVTMKKVEDALINEDRPLWQRSV